MGRQCSAPCTGRYLVVRGKANCSAGRDAAALRQARSLTLLWSFSCLFVSVHGYLFRVKLISWNVNGLRSILRKNFLEFLDSEKPDVLCLQEIKCGPNDVEQLW